MNKYLKQLQTYNEKVKNFNYCLNMIYWDMETEKEFPIKAVDRTGGVIEFLSKEITNLLVSEETKEMIDYLTIHANELSQVDRRQVQLLKRNYERNVKIPVELIGKYENLKVKAQSIWVEAKNNNDFQLFAPYLKELIEYNREFIKLTGYKDHPYNALLEKDEYGMTVEKLDNFFEKLREHLELGKTYNFQINLFDPKDQKMTLTHVEK